MIKYGEYFVYMIIISCLFVVIWFIYLRYCFFVDMFDVNDLNVMFDKGKGFDF